MKYLEEFRQPDRVRQVADSIARLKPPPARLMEVCGTHTMAIARYGLRSLLPAGIELCSGPGCPVCVTDQPDIDRFIAMGVPGHTLATFGDMMRVPGTTASLEEARAAGADVRVVYSPLDAVELARGTTNQVIFFGVGFETTAPAVALAIQQAQREGLRNFSVLSAHKLIPPALHALLGSNVRIDGFLCPGHVSVIIGSDAYRPVADGGVPCVIAGFEPLDILQAVLRLVQQVQRGESRVEVQYSRVVTASGNVKAQALLAEVFEPADVRWRGLGRIPGSGLVIRKELRDFDAAYRFPVEVPAPRETGCLCGDVLRGAIAPPQCPHFGNDCTPRAPLGPCMVSSEGACAAHYRFRRPEP